VDRGYFKLSYFESIDTAGGFYVVRAKATVNPLVTAAYNRQGKLLKRFTYKKQKDDKYLGRKRPSFKTSPVDLS